MKSCPGLAAGRVLRALLREIVRELAAGRILEEALFEEIVRSLPSDAFSRVTFSEKLSETLPTERSGSTACCGLASFAPGRS